MSIRTNYEAYTEMGVAYMNLGESSTSERVLRNSARFECCALRGCIVLACISFCRTASGSLTQSRLRAKASSSTRILGRQILS